MWGHQDVNFYSSRLNCGVKAILFNKWGDMLFLIICAYVIGIMGGVLYVPIELFNMTLVFLSSTGSLSFALPLLFILFPLSKSAQLPLGGWLINAMSAPTPISALLHSYLALAVVSPVFNSVVLLCAFILLSRFGIMQFDISLFTVVCF